MPEWKSFTFGEDGEATLAPEQSAPESAAPTKSAMEPDEYAAKWGTEVSKVTIERISKVLDGDGLPHGEAATNCRRPGPSEEKEKAWH